MTTKLQSGRARLSVDIDPELRRRLKIAAAMHDQTIREFIVSAIMQALKGEVAGTEAEEGDIWTRLSEPVFARDWVSDEDRVYDTLEKRGCRPRIDALHQPGWSQMAASHRYFC